MKTFALSGFALSASMATALLAGCSGSQPPIGAPGVMPQAAALASRTASTNYKVVYSFGAYPDGSEPLAPLINMNGTLFGTTQYGGTHPEDGTVFSVTENGTEKVLYSFAGPPDGAFPVAGLTNVNGALYGTTFSGGAYNDAGTVFSITKSGTEKVLHSFGNGNDGKYPDASLLYLNGTFYGTTQDGGAHGRGTIFSINKSGIEKVLHSAALATGAYPESTLVNVNGTLYGTTAGGGAQGHGAIFALRP